MSLQESTTEKISFVPDFELEIVNIPYSRHCHDSKCDLPEAMRARFGCGRNVLAQADVRHELQGRRFIPLEAAHHLGQVRLLVDQVGSKVGFAHEFGVEVLDLQKERFALKTVHLCSLLQTAGTAERKLWSE